jgi:hypothetical protein
MTTRCSVDHSTSPTRSAAMLCAVLLSLGSPVLAQEDTSAAQPEVAASPVQAEAIAPAEASPAPEEAEARPPQPALERATEASAVETATTPPAEDVAPGAPAEAARPPIGLTLGVEVSSAYVFRGLNVFQESNQLDQHFLFAPALSYTVPRTGLSLGYWGAFCLNGVDTAGLVDAALSHEQDLIVSYSWTLLPDTLTLTAGLTWYFYPFADKAVTGTAFASYLEPGVALVYTGPVTLSLQVAYFIGLADSLWPYSYVYFRPRLSRAVELGSVFSFNFAVGFGYKQFTDPGDMELQNRFDVQLDWELPIHATEHLTITPAMHLAWTDLANRGLDTEFAVWGGVVIGVGL